LRRIGQVFGFNGPIVLTSSVDMNNASSRPLAV
jgi:hypothetical protein